LLSIKDLHSRYGRIEVLHGVSVEVGKGKVVALIGANGAGKSTLMRTISGVQPVTGGSISFEGKPLGGISAHARVAMGIAQVPEGRHIFTPLPVEDNLAVGAWTLDRAGRADKSRINWIYEAFPILYEKRRIAAGNLSGGQQQMLAIGRALMSRPQLLLLDEPSMGLAPIIVTQIFRALRQLKDEGMTILIVEQNANAALAFADHAYVMETGTIALEGPAQTIAADPRVREAYLGI